ncbi:MAG: hypothetical protein ACLRQ0_13745 [Monoglobales bacterium]
MIVGLSDEEDEDKQGFLRMLDVLLTSSKTVGEKREILKSDFDIEMTDEMNEEVSIMCNLSQGILEKGLKQGREEGRAEGIKEGRAEGIKEGRAEGLAEGLERGIANSLLNVMKNLDMTEEQAMAALCIPQDEQDKYKSLLRDCEEI